MTQNRDMIQTMSSVIRRIPSNITFIAINCFIVLLTVFLFIFSLI